jgi:hypothetical protein
MRTKSYEIVTFLDPLKDLPQMMTYHSGHLTYFAISHVVERQRFQVVRSTMEGGHPGHF